MQALRFLSIVVVFLLAPMSAVHADEPATQDKAKQIWQVLDYLAVDYTKAVKDGKVINTIEYAEMQEFAHAAQRQMAELPTTPATPKLLSSAITLREAIASKAPPETVAEQARNLAADLVIAYPVPMSPNKVPSLQQGATLYQSQCASCHGVLGHSDGPLAAKLNPPPIALADHERARERSIFSLQQIISRGVDGTPMPSFAQMSEDDRWAVAYFASTLSYTDIERQTGAKLWVANPALHAAVPNLARLSQTSEVTLMKTAPPDTARALLAYLRSAPEVLNGSSVDSLGIAKKRLTESVAALDKGDAASATRLALSAYLDGFEPVEPALAAKNNALFEDIEKSMGLYRNAVSNRQPVQAHNIERRLQTLLTEAESALDSSNDPLSTFVGALTILLREGLEALLVVVAMMAFLKKAERQDVLPYVHAGWIAALAAGGLTWVVATYVVDLSGAGREMTEGFSAVFAALVLLSVGIWMHQKSLAGRWQAYVKQKLSSALNKKSVVMLFLLSFITVYREVFETVLFYIALWTPTNGIYLLAGLGSGIAILGVIAVILLRSTAKLPISQFFLLSSVLVGLLAIVLMGKGMAALQKVGFLEITPISAPRIDVLGIYPSMQGIVAQALILFIIVASVIYNLRTQKSQRA